MLGMGYRGKMREQEEARCLRAEGLTMPAIAERLGVSRSSVSLWTRDVPFTPGPDWGRYDRAPRGPNALQRRKADEIAHLRAEGLERIGRLSERDLLIAGTALYAGEGSKGDGCVSFANSHAGMVRLFARWLRTFFEVDEDRLRVRLYLHQGLDYESAVQHWGRVTGVPPQQFGAPYRAVPDPSIRRAKHVHGCAHMSYACSRTHRAVMGLVQALVPQE